MSNDFKSSDDRGLLLDTIAADKDSVHFFWNCRKGRVTQLCGDLVPEGIGDPFAYLCNKKYVKETSLAAFGMFCGKIKGSIDAGTDESRITADFPIRLTENEDYRMCHMSVILLKDGESRVISVYVSMRFYREREMAERRILDSFTSDKDPGIFARRIQRMMDRNPEREIAYIQFDVERFKLINDAYGEKAGDRLLKYLKDSLTVICSDEQPFARLTADVFMVVIPFDEESEIIDFIHNLEDNIGRSYDGMEFRLIWGVCIVEDRTLQTRTHGDNATLARQSIKGNALNNIGFYNGKLKHDLYHQHYIEDDMTNAMLNNEFVMYLQPKCDISSGEIIGAEALARWMHPYKGLIPPDQFVPIFEKNGFILKLDQLMWEKACRQIRLWIDEGIEPVPISVNISREYLNSFDVVGKFNELVEKYCIPVKLLEAEITESCDADNTSDVVRKMKNCGFTMLMDDFGSGFSSLNMLKTTPFDVLKIDRGFLSEFMESERGRKIIAHTISMSRDIGLNIIAEGVETDAQAQFLKNCGCDTAQGFYYSKPIPVEEFDRQLMDKINNGERTEK
ncbi:MAG: bifunctional diguanylate cyclase/phosphodiesterase [Alistipes sp.]|nr:bifunctional diguanylate cyclase/phosphodiesterase [Alistipes sp.]